MSDPLNYATPEYQRATPTSVGFRLGLLGLGLILLCGCFMIGIMMVQFEPQSPLVPSRGSPLGRLFFVFVLYLFAFVCFGGGVYVTATGVKRLVQS